MKTMRKSKIVAALLAVLAAAMLFVTYGTVLPAAPFAAIQLDEPSTVDSDGEMTAIVDSESRRVLILNSDGDLTGVVSCAIADSPFEAITDVCSKDGLIYVSGVRFAPDSDIISKERVAAYDKGGNFKAIVFESDGTDDSIPRIKSLSNAPGGVVLAYDATPAADPKSTTENNADGTQGAGSRITFTLINMEGSHEIGMLSTSDTTAHDVAFSTSGEDHYALLNVLGALNDGIPGHDSRTYAHHVFTAVDIDEDGILYACDDESGALCAIQPNSTEVHEIIPGGNFNSVHENSGIISACDSTTNNVTLCDHAGNVLMTLSEVKPSIGFSARMVLVWASGIYLAGLAIVLAARKASRLVKEGRTEGLGAMFTAIAVAGAIAVAIGNLSFASYQSLHDSRAREINMCADYLQSIVQDLSEPMERANDRDSLHGEKDKLDDAALSLLNASAPAITMVTAATDNQIGMYFTLYGKDDKGIFYLIGSSQEYVMGSSAKPTGNGELDIAFEGTPDATSELLRGHTLRDATLYRLVQIPSTDGKSVAGVIEIGSRMRTFEASIAGNEARRVLALLVMVLVVYLAYSEIRACGRCLLSYRQQQQDRPNEAIAILTRPFTLAITMLSGIDSVMTVLIARELLTVAGIGDTSPLLALPAVMLGVGLIIGQGLYGFAGPRVGLRRLMTTGAIVMLACAVFTGAAVVSGVFWLYCVAKLAMAIPFGMLYSLGYSLPRLAKSDEVRAEAAGGVKRTDTSAAALGTVLGGYAAQVLGNVWVYVIVAVACLPVILMALNLLPRGMQPLEAIAQPDRKNGHIRSFITTRPALSIAFLVVLPATVAAGYASFLFPIYSIDLGLSKSDINNFVVLGQLIVYICIDFIDRTEARFGKWRVTTAAVALLGVVFLLFSVNTTLVWSAAVIALVAVLCKSSDGWKALWLKAAGDAGVATGAATGAMFATRSLALVAQPFVLGALLGFADSVAIIAIGVICVVCAALFFLTTRSKLLA